MGAFQYTALTSQGKQTKGIIEADSERIVRQEIRSKGLLPLHVQPVTQRNKHVFSKKIRLTDLSLFLQQLATLLGAGLPLVDALLAVADQTEKSHVKNIIHGLRSKVMEGYALSAAMAGYKEFPELYQATVRAGEQTGHLDAILLRLAEYAEQQLKIQQKIQQALIYPALMILISMGIVSFLLAVVVPKIIGVFNTAGQQLPFLTTILIQLSQIIVNDGLYILLALLFFGIILRRLLRQEKYLNILHQMLLKIPLLGYGITTVNTARYARTVGILFAAGVPIIEAMGVAASLITHLPMRKSIQHAAQYVREGANIHLALKQTNYFSPMTVHLIASGESSGRLEQMLTRVADNEEQAVTRLIETGLTLFEPLIIFCMGGVVLFIVLAILLPIFELNQFVG